MTIQVDARNDLPRWRCGAVAVFGALVLVGCSPAAPPPMTGWIEADLVYISAPAAGVLQQVAVRRGERVAADALLFRLDADAEALARLQSEAQAAQARAQAANLKSGRRAPEVAAVAEQLAQAEAARDASAAQLKRNEDLVRQGFVSASVLDTLRASAQRDAARVAELRSQLQVARLAARPQEIAAADAAAEAARAQAALNAWRLSQRAQHSPVAAQVFDVTYRQGERVAANAPVVTLLPDGALKLRFFAPQAQLAALPVGAEVNVTCDGCPPDLRARVSFVSPQAEFTPPVIYSNDSRSKLVFMIEARPLGAAASALVPGQPIDARPVAAAGTVTGSTTSMAATPAVPAR